MTSRGHGGPNDKSNKPQGHRIRIEISNPLAGMKDPDYTKEPVQEVYHHKGVGFALFKATWDEKLAKPERWMLLFNEDKLSETIANPDEIRQSESPNIKDEEIRKNHHIYYKKVGSWKVSAKGDILSLSSMAYLAVVIDIKHRRIRTFYATDRAKEGKRIWPS